MLGKLQEIKNDLPPNKQTRHNVLPETKSEVGDRSKISGSKNVIDIYWLEI